jgi:hypothetical protein
MAMLNYSIHARERVTDFVAAGDLDRLAQLACAAAEQAPDWRPGDEFVFEIEEQQYIHPGIELSALIVCHRGATYEVFYYDGPMAEIITANCSWDR